MAVFHYNLLVVMCRERGDTKAVGSKTYSEPTREEWNFLYQSADLEGGAAHAAFRDAMEADLVNAPQHISKIKKSGTGSLKEALVTGGTITNDGVATEGVWSERVGKDVFRYEIGVASAGGASEALSNRTAHNLS
tara:strand:+ start:312 stop:716 length:405 start_codon:yes stop_codon:yes gene_type:complete